MAKKDYSKNNDQFDWVQFINSTPKVDFLNPELTFLMLSVKSLSENEG